MAASSKIIDLRHLLAERFPQAPISSSALLPTGLQPLDAAIGGGLPRGAITELTSPQLSAGSASVIHRLLAAAQTERYFFALIDGRDSFDPQSLSKRCLRHLLWIRCRQTSDAIKAADLLLRDGNFPLVILDLVLNAAEELRKIPQTNWYRLQRLVEPAPTALLILTRHSFIQSAQVKLVLENAWRLSDLLEENNLAQLHFRMRRMQGGRQEMARVG